MSFLNPFAGVGQLLHLLLFVVQVAVFIDAAIRPSPAYVAAGKQTKTLWLVILGIAALVGIGLGLLGLAAAIATIVYWVDVRPALQQVQGRGNRNSPW